MALLDLWKSKPAEYGKKKIQQLVGIAGDGTPMAKDPRFANCDTAAVFQAISRAGDVA